MGPGEQWSQRHKAERHLPQYLASKSTWEDSASPDLVPYSSQSFNSLIFKGTFTLTLGQCFCSRALLAAGLADTSCTQFAQGERVA